MLFPFIAGLIAFILLVKPLNNRTLKMTINGTRKNKMEQVFYFRQLCGLYFLLFICSSILNLILQISLLIIKLLLLSFFRLFQFCLFHFRQLSKRFFSEDILCRDLQHWLKTDGSLLIMTSVLFGLMHAFNPEVKEFGFFTMMPQYITFGLIFGIITILDDGIEAAMGAHTANNIFLCIMVTNRSSALQTPALYEQYNIHPWTEFAALVVTGIIFIIILKMIFRWKDFSVTF